MISFTEKELATMFEQAKRDDWHKVFVGSEIRVLIAMAQRSLELPSYVNSGWKLCKDNAVDGFAFYDPDEEVTLYCMVKGDVYEYTVKLPPLDISGERS